MKVFCAGLFRTGTTTMQEMFARSFSSDHEFQLQDQLSIFERRLLGTISDAEIRAFIHQRSAAKPLNMDSCGAHFTVVDFLVEEFPDAKFLLTLRDIYSWMNSCVGKLLGDFTAGWGSRAGALMNCLDVLPDGRFLLTNQPNMKIRLEQMAKIWTGVNQRVIAAVPKERLLVVHTEELVARSGEIAAFCGIDPDLLDPIHANAGRNLNFLQCFDSQQIEELVQMHCRQLMEEHYPELTLARYAAASKDAPCPDCQELARYFTVREVVPTEFVQTRFPV